MRTKRFGNVEIRHFIGNDSVYVMYKEHKFFMAKEDAEDFKLAMFEIEKEKEIGYQIGQRLRNIKNVKILKE